MSKALTYILLFTAGITIAFAGVNVMLPDDDGTTIDCTDVDCYINDTQDVIDWEAVIEYHDDDAMDTFVLYNGKEEVGRVTWGDGFVDFEGDFTQAAMIFFREVEALSEPCPPCTENTPCPTCSFVERAAEAGRISFPPCSHCH